MPNRSHVFFGNAAESIMCAGAIGRDEPTGSRIQRPAHDGCWSRRRTHSRFGTDL